MLNNQHISDEQFAHANKVWNTFNLKNVGEYHDLYLKSDILPLADCFELSERLVFNITNQAMLLFYKSWTSLGCYVKND